MSNFTERLTELMERETTTGYMESHAFLIRYAPAIRDLVLAAEPFAQFARKFEQMPILRIGDAVYTIHSGTQWEAALRRGDCVKVLEALAKLEEA